MPYSHGIYKHYATRDHPGSAQPLPRYFLSALSPHSRVHILYHSSFRPCCWSWSIQTHTSGCTKGGSYGFQQSYFSLRLFACIFIPLLYLSRQMEKSLPVCGQPDLLFLWSQGSASVFFSSDFVHLGQLPDWHSPWTAQKKRKSKKMAGSRYCVQSVLAVFV